MKIGKVLKKIGKNSLSPILLFFDKVKIIPSKKFVPKPIKESLKKKPELILKNDKITNGNKASQLVLCEFK